MPASFFVSEILSLDCNSEEDMDFIKEHSDLAPRDVFKILTMTERRQLVEWLSSMSEETTKGLSFWDNVSTHEFPSSIVIKRCPVAANEVDGKNKLQNTFFESIKPKDWLKHISEHKRATVTNMYT